MAGALTVDLERRLPGGPVVRAAFAQPAGAQVVVLFGPSGSGKTTVLRALAGLDRPDAGRIDFGGETWFDAARGVCVPPQRRRVGYLAQAYALFPHLSVRDNVAYGLGALPAGERAGRAAEAMALLGVEGLAGRRPRTLSGGEGQRVALARALATRPRLLLLDEPLSALDAPTRERLRRDLRGLLRRVGTPAVVVTHDRAEALALGDALVVMAGGRVRQSGPVPEVFSRPADPEVAAVVGVETVAPGMVLGTDGGLATVAVGPARLEALADGRAGEVFVCIRAEDVTLETGGAHPSSARNRLPGVVRDLAPEGPMVRVALDCGFPLAALITKQSCEALALAEGAAVTAVVKVPAVHLVARG